MKLGKTEKAILSDIAKRGKRFGRWNHTASSDKTGGARQVNACLKLADRGIVTVVSRNHYQLYMGPRHGMIHGFEITIELAPEKRTWVMLGGEF